MSGHAILPGHAILEHVDSVYFFMYRGWREELRSNRWHYATRWARHRPVVLIQAERSDRKAWHVEAEPRIPGATILSVLEPDPDRGFSEDSLRIIHQIGSHMRERRHERPLFWFYWPLLFPAYAALPATLRIYHASENYWDFEGLHPVFSDLMPRAMLISDRVIAVSSGVEEGIEERVPAASVWELSNGCDYSEYGGAKASARWRAECDGFDRLAVYAGNVNARLDFDLLARCAERFPRFLFVLVGPVKGLSTEDARRWEHLRALPNVRAHGPLPPSELPGLYAAADVGLIPYRRTPMIERNGFPLKTFEMAATGLPVVSTYMRPLEAIAEPIPEAIRLTRTPEDFVGALSRTSRASLSREVAARMDAEARARDYEVLFEQLLTRMTAEAPRRARAIVHLDALAETASTSDYLELATFLSEPCRRRLERCSASAARGLAIRARRAVARPSRGS